MDFKDLAAKEKIFSRNPFIKSCKNGLGCSSIPIIAILSFSLSNGLRMWSFVSLSNYLIR